MSHGKLVLSNVSKRKIGPIRHRVRPALLMACGVACDLKAQGLLGSKESSLENNHHGARILTVRTRSRRACTVPQNASRFRVLPKEYTLLIERRICHQSVEMGSEMLGGSML
jgi:hypothetical protein